MARQVRGDAGGTGSEAGPKLIRIVLSDGAQDNSRVYMISIDGAAKSGSGTIVRYSVALASLLGKEMNP